MGFSKFKIAIKRINKLVLGKAVSNKSNKKRSLNKNDVNNKLTETKMELNHHITLRKIKREDLSIGERKSVIKKKSKRVKSMTKEEKKTRLTILLKKKN